MGALRLQAAAMGLLATALGLLAAALGLLAAALMPYATRLMQDGAEAFAVMEQNAGTPAKAQALMGGLQYFAGFSKTCM